MKMEGIERKKASAFLLATNELMAENFQRDMDRMRKELRQVKFENHILRIKCGDIAEILTAEDSLLQKDGDVSAFKTSIASWGEVSAFLPERQVRFFKKIFLFAIQSEIVRERDAGELVFDIMSPISALKAMVNEYLSRQVCISQTELNDFLNLICSIICLREYNIRHDDMQGIVEIFKNVILLTCNNCPAADSFLGVLMGNCVSGIFTTYVACQMCEEVSDSLVGQSLGMAAAMDSTPKLLYCLVRICQACLSNLSEWCRQTDPKEVMIEDIANNVSKISGHCDVLSAMYPEAAIEGKRCSCILVACLQAMQQY